MLILFVTLSVILLPYYYRALFEVLDAITFGVLELWADIWAVIIKAILRRI